MTKLPGLLILLILVSSVSSHAAPFAYFVTASNTLTTVDTATNSVAATVNVGQTPFSATVNSQGSRVYVSNFDSNTVSIVDTSLNLVIGTIPVPAGPQGLTLNQSGTRLYVASSKANRLATIDTATNATVASIPLPLAAEVIINSAGTRLYVAVDQAIAVVDPATDTVLASVSILGSSGIIGMSLSNDGNRLYAWDIFNFQIVVIDTFANTVVKKIPVPTVRAISGTAVHPVTGGVYAADGNKVAIVDPITNTVITTISLGTTSGASGTGVHGIAFTPDGSYAYAATDSGIVGINTATNTLLPLIPGSAKALDHFIGPEGVAPPRSASPVPALEPLNLLYLASLLVLGLWLPRRPRGDDRPLNE